MSDHDIVLFDLDGTLADIEHRRHLVECEEPRWREFYAARSGDAPNESVVKVFKVFRSSGFQLWIVSGRSDEVADETIKWLSDHGIEPHRLLMRKAKDHQPDLKLKRSWILDGTIPRDRVLCAFDDRTSVVEMWRSERIPCYQVAPGDF